MSVLQDELIATEAIFPGHVFLSEGSENTYIVRLPDTDIQFCLSFDKTYPIASPRVSDVVGTERAHLIAEMDACAGQEVLFTLLSGLLERQSECEAQQQQQGSIEHDEQQEGISITHMAWSVSDALQDRKSTFIARACRVTSQNDVQRALASVDAKRATHPKIWACRYRDKSTTTRFVMESDDDGETAAGGRLAFLLDITKAEDVLVVVSRWFGGVLLGDVRFKHINTVAREALERGSYLPHDDGRSPPKK